MTESANVNTGADAQSSLNQTEANQTKTTELERIFESQRQAFAQNRLPPAKQRIEHLKRLNKVLAENQEAIIAAIDTDFSCRARDETLLAELLPSVEGIRYAARRVKKWMQPARRHVGILFQPAKARIIYQPLGVVGIVVPWNYPLYLAVGPLTAALAAGNRAMIKTSRNAPEFGRLFKKLMAEAFNEDHVAVITTEESSGSAFVDKPWDHLLFTGSTATGRRVMAAAAEHLTPVTLELGGKSPAIISPEVPMTHAAERIAFGKQFNAGQTCVAPDYVLCPKERIEEFSEIFQKCVAAMYPTMAKNPQYTSIISAGQYKRLTTLLTDAETKRARVIPVNPTGESFAQTGKLPVYLILDANEDMQVLQEEIFGPLLPVVGYDSLADAADYVNARPRPLALYYFDYNKKNIHFMLTRTHSGGVMVNDTLMHVAQDDLPFGGVGASGMGEYHSREGFLTFSKAKGVMIRPRFNSGRLVYPPYGRWIHRMVYKLFIR